MRVGFFFLSQVRSHRFLFFCSLALRVQGFGASSSRAGSNKLLSVRCQCYCPKHPHRCVVFLYTWFLTFLRFCVSSLAGAYEFDAASVYFGKDHEIYRSWVALSDTTDTREGVQARYLARSLTSFFIRRLRLRRRVTCGCLSQCWVLETSRRFMT